METKYEGVSKVRGEVRPGTKDAVYIRRKRYEKGERSGGFFSKLYRQFLATMAALILLFGMNLVPLTKGYLQEVKDAVQTDYIEDVLAVFGEH